MRSNFLLTLLILVASCGDGDAGAKKRRAYPSSSFSDLIPGEVSTTRCQDGKAGGCALIEIGFNSVKDIKKLQGLRVVCSYENDSRVVEISNAFGTSSTFELKMRFSDGLRGVSSCSSLAEDQCDMSGVLQGKTFHSSNGKGCFIDLKNYERTEVTLMCEDLKALNSRVIISGGSRLACSD
jgi:hypothetical protein